MTIALQRVLADLDRARVVCGDAVEMLYLLEPESVDVVFADPPYFLSRSGGTTCSGGKSVSVVKGAWDKPEAVAEQGGQRLELGRGPRVRLAAVRVVLDPQV